MIACLHGCMRAMQLAFGALKQDDSLVPHARAQFYLTVVMHPWSHRFFLPCLAVVEPACDVGSVHRFLRHRHVLGVNKVSGAWHGMAHVYVGMVWHGMAWHGMTVAHCVHVMARCGARRGMARRGTVLGAA